MISLPPFHPHNRLTNLHEHVYLGGVHVEAFISSPLLAPVSPMNYSGLFHVTDWFPTILSMANLSFTPADGYALDGFDHYSNIIGRLNGRQDAREYLLVNYYMPDTDTATSLWTGYPFAIMNRRYKLIHTYNNSAGAW